MAVSLFVYVLVLSVVVQSFKFESQKIIPFTDNKAHKVISKRVGTIVVVVVSIVASKEKRCQKQK